MQEDLLKSLKEVLSDQEIEELEISLTKEAYSGLRVNLLKCKIEKITQYFNLRKHPFFDYGFIFNKKELPLGKDVFHQAGLYYIQEPSAMIVGGIIPLDKEDYVLDLCAAPGGKTTHVAMLLENKGLVVSNDIGYDRAIELSYNVERLGITNCLVTCADPSYFSQNLMGFFDKVILDAPCSGLGMIRKNELSKLDWNLNKVNKLVEIQKDLIMKAYKCLKYQGILSYSTCTFTKEENEDIINYLLENTNAKVLKIELREGLSSSSLIEGAIRIYPHKFEGEGHFICLIESNDHYPSLKIYYQKEANHHLVTVYRKWEEENLNIKLEGYFYDFKGHLYLSKEPLFNLDKLRVLRCGLYLGEINKDRFLPSHSLALALKKEDFKQVMDLKRDSQELKDFLKGMTLTTKYLKNYVLVCVDSFPLGMGKASQGILKNLLPKGVRK